MASTIQERAEWFQQIESRLEAAAACGAARFKKSLLQTVEYDVAQGRCESPIEAIFEAWFLALTKTGGHSDINLMAQQVVVVGGDTFRIDFTVVLAAHPGTYGSGVFTDYPQIAIELDGHDYHERTKEQVTYRNRRDRALQGAGWKVFHVSGSELYRSSEECVQSVIDLVTREYSQFWSRYWDDVNSKAAERAAAKTKQARELTGEPSEGRDTGPVALRGEQDTTGGE